MAELMKVAEVAAELRVSRMTVYRLIETRQLGVLRVGRSFRIPREAVAAYVQGATTDADVPEIPVSISTVDGEPT